MPSFSQQPQGVIGIGNGWVAAKAMRQGLAELWEPLNKPPLAFPVATIDAIVNPSAASTGEDSQQEARPESELADYCGLCRMCNKKLIPFQMPCRTYVALASALAEKRALVHNTTAFKEQVATVSMYWLPNAADEDLDNLAASTFAGVQGEAMDSASQTAA